MRCEFAYEKLLHGVCCPIGKTSGTSSKFMHCMSEARSKCQSVVAGILPITFGDKYQKNVMTSWFELFGSNSDGQQYNNRWGDTHVNE